jgi:hypothetical protein
MVLRTTFETGAGVVELIDTLVAGQTVEFSLHYAIKLDEISSAFTQTADRGFPRRAGRLATPSGP